MCLVILDEALTQHRFDTFDVKYWQSLTFRRHVIEARDRTICDNISDDHPFGGITCRWR